MSIATAKRRRRQAAMNNAHLSGMGISRYRKSDATASARKLAEIIRKERQMAINKGRK